MTADTRLLLWQTALLGVALLPACVVSFDGYTLDGSDASGGTAGTSTGGAAGMGGQAGSAGASGSAGTGGTGGAGTGGVAGSGGAGGFTSCPLGKPGPGLLEIPNPAGGIYCIDRTEVTNAHYKAFLDAPKTGLVQPPACQSNSSFAPETGPACSATNFNPTGEPTHPVTCIDWCDAHSYCTWAGKQLCGSLSAASLAPADFDVPSRSQWHGACTKNGQRKFPYDGPYQSLYCNGGDSPSARAVPVATLANCVGGYDGLYDMSGNVWEWEDSCDGAGNCVERGGSFLEFDTGAFTLRCNSASDTASNPPPPLAPRLERSSQRGFRCCLAG